MTSLLKCYFYAIAIAIGQAYPAHMFDYLTNIMSLVASSQKDDPGPSSHVYTYSAYQLGATAQKRCS